MGAPSATLMHAYRQWHDSEGVCVATWLDLVADDVKVYSLAAGAPEAAFTAAVTSKKDFERYFKGLLADWEMIHYTTGTFIAEGECVAMLGSTGWRNRKTGRVLETPKSDFWTFRGDKIVEFHELYDTAALLVAARG